MRFRPALLLALLAGSALLFAVFAPLPAEGQPTGKVRRLGFLSLDALGSETAQQQQRD